MQKENKIQVRPKEGRVININKSNKVLYEIGNSQITYGEVFKKIENIHSDIDKIFSIWILNLNQVNVLNILFIVNEIFTGESESVGVNEKGDFEIFKEKQEPDEEPDATDMPELESEQSASERRNELGQGLKILTASPMLSRLPISLAQLKAGNNSEKLKNDCIVCIVQKNLQSNSMKV